MVGIRGKSFAATALAEVGVRRISLATSLYRAAITALITAATEAKASGTFSFVDAAITTIELNRYLED
jgi:2-methylisocitrate lyase-like PEP mutase family enzyme